MKLNVHQWNAIVRQWEEEERRDDRHERRLHIVRGVLLTLWIIFLIVCLTVGAIHLLGGIAPW